MTKEELTNAVAVGNALLEAWGECALAQPRNEAGEFDPTPMLRGLGMAVGRIMMASPAPEQFLATTMDAVHRSMTKGHA